VVQAPVHIWTKSKLPWVIIPEGVETHEAQPQQIQRAYNILARLARRHQG
jgi:hypothetical protein